MSMLRVRRQIQGSPLVVCMVSCQQILQIYSSIWKTSYRPASDISSTHFPVEHHVSPALLPKVLHTLLHGSRHATLTPPPLSMGTAFVTVTHPHSLLTTLLLLQKKQRFATLRHVTFHDCPLITTSPVQAHHSTLMADHSEHPPLHPEVHTS